MYSSNTTEFANKENIMLRVIAWILVPLSFGLALSRALITAPTRPPSNTESSASLTQCLPRIEIPTGVSAKVIGRTNSGNKQQSGKLLAVANAPIVLPIPESELTKNANSFQLKDRTLQLTKEKASFGLIFHGSANITRGNLELPLEAPDSIRFGPVENISYTIVGDGTVPVVTEGNTRRVIVEAGSQLGEVSIQKGQVVKVLEPINTGRSGEGDFFPARINDGPGVSNVAIAINSWSAEANTQEMRPIVCVKDELAPAWIRAGVSQVKSNSDSATIISIDLRRIIHFGIFEFVKPVQFAVASADSRYVAMGDIFVFNQVWSAMIATFITVVLTAIVMKSRTSNFKDGTGKKRFFSGIFVGPDNDPSLSLLQMFIWTVITIWGLLYVFTLQGNLLSVTADVLALLGIAGTGTVLARWIAVSTGRSTSQPVQGAKIQVANTPSGTTNAFWQMLSTNGDFDLLKLQLFAFTVVIAIYVISSIAANGAFPSLDSNTLLLMGVSQGVYISGKLSATSSLTSAQALKLDLEMRIAEQKNLADARQLLEDKKAKLDAQVKNLNGAMVPQPLTDNLNANTQALAENDQKSTAVKTVLDKLRLDYETALNQIGLKL